MKAINHTLQQLGLDLDNFRAESPLQPVEALTEYRIMYADASGFKKPFIINKESGQSRWDWPDCGDGGNLMHHRLSLCPNEGSPLFTVFQYLSGAGFSVHLNRDSLPLNSK